MPPTVETPRGASPERRRRSESPGNARRTSEGSERSSRLGDAPRGVYAVEDAAVEDAAAEGAKVFRSADGGAHWAERDAGLPTPPKEQRLSALEIDPDQPNTLYAGFLQLDPANLALPALYETTDGGGHWTGSTTLRAFEVPPRPGLAS
ncbi:MAG TPA: hypothetical protein VIE43_20050 [Thermoanaerobaculia bacterium]|nr:hypothetical protein [Thermoanaerobaculia bacterium]